MADPTKKISPRVFSDLKKRSFVGVFIYSIALGTVLFADGYYFRHPQVSNRFLAVMTGICLLRLIHDRSGSWIPARLALADIYLFFTGIVLTAVVWGTGSAAFMVQPGEMNIRLLMVVCTVGICAGGCAVFSPCLWLALAFNLCMLWPGILALLFQGENLPLAVLFIIFSIYMALMSTRIHTEYRAALENEALLKQKTKDLEKLSNMDGLTGLYNRRYFDTALEIGWQSAARNRTCMALILCDIDFFKRVNDAHGHLAGDEYLRTVAHTLNRIFRRQTDIVARFGGEEFVVLMGDVKKGSAACLAETFRQQVARTRLQFETRTIATTVSLGIAEITPGPDIEPEALIARADAMLYRAKNTGRDQVVVYDA
ncbi:MAG: GGDEF domain-containing protein [Desulfobacter sp.]